MPSVEFVETVEALEAAEQPGEAELVNTNSTLTDTETARLSEIKFGFKKEKKYERNCSF